MIEPRIRSEVWVSAQLRLALREGRIITVLRKGDADAGVVILKLRGVDGLARLLAQATAPDGGFAWHWPLGAKPMAEADADAYIAREATFDPDIWAVEIEDRAGDWLPEGRILGPD